LVGQSDCFIAYNLAIWDTGPALALAPALGLAVEWVSEPLNVENILNKGYIHTVVFGKPSLVSQIVQALRNVR
jgi:fructose-1,6-bisphosphatase/inositol monophosphatase family enzyme